VPDGFLSRAAAAFAAAWASMAWAEPARASEHSIGESRATIDNQGTQLFLA